MKKRFILIVIAMAIKACSPLMRAAIKKGVNTLYLKAKETDVEYDDMLVEALAELLDVELE